MVDHVTVNLDFFSSFFKVSLLYHLLFLEDVFNNSFWKICIKIPNYVEPGLNLLEKLGHVLMVNYAVVHKVSKWNCQCLRRNSEIPW